MTTCAACLQPLENGQRAKIVGTEVFHRQCSSGRSVQGYALKQAKRKLDQASAELGRLRQERDLARQDADANRRDVARAHQQIDHLTRKHQVIGDQMFELQALVKQQKLAIDQAAAEIARLRMKRGIDVEIGAPRVKPGDDIN